PIHPARSAGETGRCATRSGVRNWRQAGDLTQRRKTPPGGCIRGRFGQEVRGRTRMRHFAKRWAPLALTAVLLLSGCTDTSMSELPEGAVTIARQGSFEAGGRIVGDPAAASLACDHGHVEYQIPGEAKPTALVLWHSSSAAVWQRRWDGGEGYQTKLLRAGYPTYVWDGPRVGRANWSCEDYAYEAQAGRDQGNFGAWRLGPRYGEFYPGLQFPVNDPAALEQANRARYNEFDTVSNAQLETDAAAVAMDRIGPSVLLTNSAGGFR